MSAAEVVPMVRIFVPNGDDGYTLWSDLTEGDRQQKREQILGTVRRAAQLKYAGLAAEEHKAEVRRRVRELIGALGEGTC